MPRTPTTITDGCSPELVEGERFDGVLEVPVIERLEVMEVPSNLVPFSQRGRVDPERYGVCFYEDEAEFAELLRNPAAYVDDLRRYQLVVSPDTPSPWNAPLSVQVAHRYHCQAVGAYLQRQGVHVIPSVHWGDERTYTSSLLHEPLAFLGVERRSIVAVGAHGQVRTPQQRRQFAAGLRAMVSYLEPYVVLVYGSVPSDMLEPYGYGVEFVRYPDWASHVGADALGELEPAEEGA